MDATTARKALHNWIDTADDPVIIILAELAERLRTTVDQVIDQGLAARGLKPGEDGMLHIPYTRIAGDDAPPAPVFIPVTLISSAERNRQNERRREHADWLARRSFARRGTPEQLAEWEAANPDPLLDNPEE